MHIALPIGKHNVLIANDVPEFMGRVSESENRSKISVSAESREEADKIFNEVNSSLAEKDKRRDQKKFLKEKEKELDAQFEDKLKDLTTTQGTILVKLIARETGQNCYALIKEFKNPFSAFFWQSAGKLYGYDLKLAYDPQQDHDIELIVRSIENNL